LTAIQRQVEALHQRGRQVEHLQSQLESELAQAYQQALSKLRARTQHKTTVLLCDEAVLERQKQEIDALNAFLEYQRNGNDAFHLLIPIEQQMKQAIHFVTKLTVTLI
jgi:hypothetical protein